jgi:hypothetical protein
MYRYKRDGAPLFNGVSKVWKVERHNEEGSGSWINEDREIA